MILIWKLNLLKFVPVLIILCLFIVWQVTLAIISAYFRCLRTPDSPNVLIYKYFTYWMKNMSRNLTRQLWGIQEHLFFYSVIYLNFIKAQLFMALLA